MTEIKVSASRNYSVLIGSGLLKNAGEYIKDFCKNNIAAVITDDIVDGLYYESLENSLKEKGITAVKFVMKNGESSKNAENFIAILNFLAENRLTRSDLVIALGGGVVGDITGFAAATYLRGIKFVQIPTTLLAMVDSSVGGKTAIDLERGKNLAGAFYQPSLVLCDYDALNTLPEKIFADGCAEVIKYAVLKDRGLFDYLTETGAGFDREKVIAECVAIKRDIVGEDEFEKGTRQLLNLGHTLGHAIELCSEYSVSHGSAVAVGMAEIARRGAVNGLCSEECAKNVCRLIERFSLPVNTEISGGELYGAMLSDKKRSGEKISLVIPREIGRCEIRSFDVEKMKEFFGF